MIRLAVRVARDRAELVLAELSALAPGGFEERDVDAETVEYAIYGAAGELPSLPDLRAGVGEALVHVSTSEVGDDWETRWRSWHRSLDVGPLRVRPPWEPRRAAAFDIVIDPGQAFGTGAHPSTRLTLELLLSVPAGAPLADWGCGSGVLSIAAARLGFDPILACDLDPASLTATLVAADANGIATPPAGAELSPTAASSAAAGSSAAPASPPRIIVSRCDLRRAPGPWAPTVTANLVRPLLLQIADRMERPPEQLIGSGLEIGEADEVAAAFARHGLRERARREGDGWAAILLAR